MSKESDNLRERRIFNNYELTKLGDRVWADYYYTTGRMAIGNPPGWRVEQVRGKQLYIWGKKNDPRVLMEVLKKCKELTGESTWVLSPFGGWVSKKTADKAGFKITRSITIS